MPYPSDPRAKLEWAKKHLFRLEDLARGYRESSPFRCELRKREEASEFDVVVERVRCPPAEMGLVIGDVANNARAALDHLVQRLVPEGYSDEERQRLYFPIWPREPKREQRKSLEYVTVHAREVIEKCQPFRSKTPIRHPLAILQRINNADKHRVLHIVTAVAISQRLRLRLRWQEPSSVRVAGRSEDVAVFCADWNYTPRSKEPVPIGDEPMIVGLLAVPGNSAPRVEVEPEIVFGTDPPLSEQETGDSVASIRAILEAVDSVLKELAPN